MINLKNEIDNITPDSFIKNIAIQLGSSYRLNNTPFTTNDDHYEEVNSCEDERTLCEKISGWWFCKQSKKTNIKTAEKSKENRHFIGREGLIKKFKEFLTDESKKGVYLVTGFRGLGKTSFVNKVLNDYKENKKNKNDLILVHLTIAQNKPREFDLLKLIVSSVYEKYSDFLIKKGTHEEINLKNKKSRILIELFFIAFLVFIPILIFINPLLIKEFITNEYGFAVSPGTGINRIKVVSYFLLGGSLIRIASLIFFFLNTKNKEARLRNDSQNPLTRIRLLYEKCHAEIMEDSGDTGESNLQGGIRLFIGSKKTSKQFPIADSKEMEFELQQFLKLSYEKNVDYIFIFDELDKIETGIHASTLSESDSIDGKGNVLEDAYQRQFREKKQVVISIISGLKNFFSNAQARFIFIAGREMFDASLADIADRQSSLSSIFTYVFNVESFLKEWNVNGTNNASLSDAIEEYLKNVFFQDTSVANEKSLLSGIKNYYQATDSNNLNQTKLIFTIQNFITYLIYRSNGSPKKLIKAIHEFVTDKSTFAAEKTHIFKLRNNDKGESNLYIYLNYYNQYRIGFISYLYRPFLVQFGRSLKLYSDNIILSTPYLFDHLLKFHPYAFSITNLELIPEVLSTNKTPYLREHLRHIISYLGNNHIRSTDIDLFDYKFYSRTQNEIKFVSKIFEQDAAAFNFTLDESYSVKLHIRGKIKELRSVYASFLGESEFARHQVFSIAHFNGILGDLHFFDQEYDDAIAAYSDAILPINHLNVVDMNMRDFVTLIKNKLKIGLCFEKIGSYKDALSFYTDSSMDSRRYMFYKLNNTVPISSEPAIADIRQTKSHQLRKNTEKNNGESSYHFHSSSMNDLLQVINQTFLAKIIVQEKMGSEGTSLQKLKISLGDFFQITKKVAQLSNDNFLIIANAYLLVGKLVYFKNSQTAFLNTTDLTQAYSTPDLTKGKPIPVHWDFTFKIALLDKKFKHFPQNEPESNKTPNSRRQPAAALYFYILGLCDLLKSRNVFPNLLEDILKCENQNIVFYILNSLEEYVSSDDERLTGIHYRYIATLVSSIGDCLLGIKEIEADEVYSSIKEDNNLDFKHIDLSKIFEISKIEINDIREASNDNFLETAKAYDLKKFLRPCQDKEKFSFNEIFRCYYLSASYFSKYGRNLSMSYQYRKILHVLRIISSSSVIEPKHYLFIFRKTLVLPCLQAVSKNSGAGDLHMILKAGGLQIPYDKAVNHVSNHPEFREIFFLYGYICLKMGCQVPNRHLLANSESPFSTQFSRLLELDFCAKEIFPDLSLFSSFKNGKNIRSDLKKSVSYLFSMISILRTLSIYGTDYLLGHSYRAYVHYRTATFLEKVSTLNNWKKAKKHIGERLNFLLGQGSYSSLDIEYHYTQASIYYSKALELHTAGTEYKIALEKMTYLEDDFNDSAYHFGAALDRYLMINGVFADRIKDCSEKLANLISKKNAGYFNHR